MIYNVESVGAVSQQEKKSFFVPLHFVDNTGDSPIKCQLDTGATCNVMPYNTLCEIKHSDNPDLLPTNTKLKFYDGRVVEALGECDLECRHDGG